jgi:hypothetical protein
MDNQVLDFCIMPEIFILGADGNLWLVNGAIGTAPPPRLQINSDVAGPTAYGTVRPSYMLLSVIYAPPGTNGGKSQSTVDYGTGSTTGSTVSVTKSFEAGIEIKVSVGSALNKVTAGFSFSETNTDEVSIQQTNTDTSDFKVYGPPVDGIDHDYDLFILWLNPLLRLTADTQNNVTWAPGIDGEKMLCVPVAAGLLKNPASMSPDLQQDLAAAGLGPGDYLNLLRSGANPFVVPQLDLVGPPTPIAIDPNRFLPVSVPELSYQPPMAANATSPVTSYTATHSVDQTTTNTLQVKLAVSLGASLGVSIASLDVTDSFTWTTTSSFSTESKSTQSAALAIGGPAYGYTGSINLNVYWDTIYNTFMFALE